MNYYPHHIGDFIRDTSRLNDSQCMAYLRLIWLYYESEQPLSDDIESLAFRIGSDAKTVEMLLKCYFYANASRWHHKRIDSEIAAYKNKSEKASASAKARWGNAKNMRTHSERNANQEPITNNQEPDIKTNVAQAKPSAPECAEVFAFWQQAMNSPRSVLDEKRKKLIKTALKNGYTKDQLFDAIRGCSMSAFHMGENDRGLKYNGLDLILRNAEHIDKFIDIAANPDRRAPRTTHDLSKMDYSKGARDDGSF